MMNSYSQRNKGLPTIYQDHLSFQKIEHQSIIPRGSSMTVKSQSDARHLSWVLTQLFHPLSEREREREKERLL